MSLPGLDVVRERDYPRAVLGAVAVVVLIALVVDASVSTVSFGPYNARWNGASALETQADGVGARTEIVREPSAYAGVPANETVAVVLSPTEPYTAEETAHLRRFVRQGGTLVVGMGAVLAVAAWVRNPDWRGRLVTRLGRNRRGAQSGGSPVSEAAMVEYLAAQHPTWDRERIERVVRAVRERGRP